MVGLYAGATFSSCDLTTGGASSPQPSSSTFVCGCALELANGLKPELPPDRVGLKAGLFAGGGGPEDEGGGIEPAEYFAPDASATF